MQTDTSAPATTELPPYSGDETQCAKCSNPDALTRYRPARGGIVRTTRTAGETSDHGPAPTSADTARTGTDTAPADNNPGVRITYTARVPRHLLGAALAEALDHIARETGTDTARTASDTESPDTSGHRAEIRAATADAFDLPPALIRKVPTS
ncbi:hypothetical protein ACH437_23750 [Streptomyces xinghaiensis]|uniref:hypothetical protein n=1 Tax=Streptomyces xinghaiensis TaxID=1038928 RepID=UPI0037B9628F